MVQQTCYFNYYSFVNNVPSIMNNSWTSAKKWLVFSYINSEDYESDLNFDGKKFKERHTDI